MQRTPQTVRRLLFAGVLALVLLAQGAGWAPILANGFGGHGSPAPMHHCPGEGEEDICL